MSQYISILKQIVGRVVSILGKVLFFLKKTEDTLEVIDESI